MHIAPHQESLEIKKHINRVLARIRLQPMADVFVVHRQHTEDLFLVRLQLCQEFLELHFVEDFPGSERPCIKQPPLGGGGNSSEDHFAEVELRPLLNAHRIGNGVRLVVIRGKRINPGLEVATMTVFFASAVPGCFDPHAIGLTSRRTFSVNSDTRVLPFQ